MPQPKSGRMIRSPGAVPRMIRSDWRTLSSYSARASALPFRASGNAVPMPRNSLAMRDFLPADEDRARAGHHDDARLGALGFVARIRQMSGAGRGLLVDEDGATTLGDGCL